MISNLKIYENFLPVLVEKQNAKPYWGKGDNGYLTELEGPRYVRNIVKEDVW